jgi:prophage regulatory protein
MKVLTYPDLAGRGIRWSRQHVWRLVKEKKFPPPFKLGLKTNAWTDVQIDGYLEERIALSGQSEVQA